VFARVHWKFSAAIIVMEYLLPGDWAKSGSSPLMIGLGFEPLCILPITVL